MREERCEREGERVREKEKLERDGRNKEIERERGKK